GFWLGLGDRLWLGFWFRFWLGFGDRLWLGFRFRLRLGFRLGRRLFGRRSAFFTDLGELAADGDRVVLLGGDGHQRARHRRRDLGVDLVGGHLDQRFVDLDGVADLLQPPRHGALGDRLAELGHRHGRRLAAAGGPRGRLGRFGCGLLFLGGRFGLRGGFFGRLLFLGRCLLGGRFLRSTRLAVRF